MKPKWKYDKVNREWYTGHDNDYYSIIKSDVGYYVLRRGTFRHLSSFKKLSSAKKVAELIING